MKKGFACMITALTFAFTGAFSPKVSASAKPKNDIEKSIEWALEIAGDDTHGYSQKVRWGPDYDCSSFVVQALREGGFKTGLAITTKNMKQELVMWGFTWIDWEDIVDESGLQRGDVLLSSHHTEIYLGNGRKVGAHSAGRYLDDNGDPITGDQDGNEISENDYKYASWEGVLRFIPKPFEDLAEADMDSGYIMISAAGGCLLGDGTFAESYDHDKLILKLTKTDKACCVENLQGEYLTVTGDEDICFCESIPDSETQQFTLYSAGEGYCIRPVCNTDKALTVSDGAVSLKEEQNDLLGQVFDILRFESFPSEHQWGEWTLLCEAEINKEGLREHICGVCGYTEQETVPVLPPPEREESRPDDSIPNKDTFVPGDTDGSGRVDIVDAVMMISHINGRKALTDEQIKRSDIDSEQGISITDAVMVIAYINGVSE